MKDIAKAAAWMLATYGEHAVDRVKAHIFSLEQDQESDAAAIWRAVLIEMERQQRDPEPRS
jgi:hypothetical protein